MEYIVGVVMGLAIGLSATWIGLDRDRALYPAVMIVIASYYALFALMADSQRALLLEILVAAIFVGAAIAGFRSTLWIVAGALAAHGVFDLFHGLVIENPGVPVWWPAFCLSIDITFAGYLGWLLLRRRICASAS